MPPLFKPRPFVLAAVLLGILGWQARAAAGTGSASSTTALPATAVATASVRILGHADADVASGAVTLIHTGTLEFAGANAGSHTVSASVAGVGGGRNAVYAVTLAPEVKVTSGARELSITTSPTFGGTGRLSPSGEGSVDVRAEIQVTATEASGRYAGFLPITVGFN